MSTLPDIQQWVKAARQDEKLAWNVLYRHYYPGLYATALRICTTIPVAEDMVQEAFITAYLKLTQLKDDGAFGSWIKKILIHTCYRGSDRHQTNVCLDISMLESDKWWEDEFNRKLDRLSAQNNLYAALVKLPQEIRSTVLLRYFSDFQSYEEIAGILCIPIGTVRSRLNQAKIKLAEQWQQHLHADMKIFKQGEEWNSFYYSALSGMHRHDHYKNRFINHLQKNIQIIFSNGRPGTGSRLFENMISDDRKFGSWLQPGNVVSCGNISVIEAKHFNSSEYPDHCPPRSVMVLYRNTREVNKMRLFLASQ